MAALDFPAAPAPGDTHTQNGVTFTFDGNAWVLNSPQIPVLGPTVQIKRTPTDNHPPSALKEGELAVEMGNPLRLWVGVPVALDPSGMKLLAYRGSGDPWVDITGDVMSGNLSIEKATPILDLNRMDVGPAVVRGRIGGVERWVAKFGSEAVEAGANSGSTFDLNAYTDAGVATTILKGKRDTNRLEVAGAPIAPNDIATKAYVDGGGAIPMTPYELGASYSGLQINGNMEISQENNVTSTAVAANTAKYSCDVWMVNWAMGAATCTTAQVQAGNCPGFPCSLRVTSAAGLAATPASEYFILSQYYEGTRWNKLQWGQGAAAKAITVSFWVSTDAVAAYPLTGTVSVRNAANNRAYCAEFQVTAINTWQFKTITIPGCPDGVWEVANNVNAANLNFGFAGGPGVRAGAANVWAVASNFISPNQSNFFAAANHSIHVTGVTVLPGSQVPTLDRYPLITRRHDQEFLNVQRWFRLFIWTLESNSGGAQQRMTAAHQFNAMRQAPAVTRASIGATLNIRNSDPTSFVTCAGVAEGGAITSTESAAAGYTQAVNVTEKFSTRF